MIGRRFVGIGGLAVALLGAGCSVTVHEGGARGSDDDGAGSAQAAILRAAPEGLFDRAMCVCGDLSAAGSLVTEAAPGEAADVGVEGDVSMAAGTHIEGSLYARGEITTAGSLDVRDDLVCGGDLGTAGSLEVGRDVSVGGDLDTVGDLSVGGTLRVRGEDDHVGDATVGARAPWSPPAGSACGCTSFDVAAAVAIARTENDDAAGGVDPGLESVGSSRVVLREGRYYFSNASAVGRLTMRVEGRVSVFVDGDLDVVGRGAIDLAEGATLDLYVAGDVHAVGSLVAGSEADPSAVRLYVGGRGSVIAGAGELDLHAFVYAPRADIHVAGDTRVVGALIAKHVSYAGELRVRWAKPRPRPPEPPPRVPAEPTPVPPPSSDAPPADAPPADAPPADPPADPPAPEDPPADADAGAPTADAG